MDKKPEKLVPEIRFKGFTDDWEQRKLKQVANIIDPHPSHRAPKQVANGIPFIGISDVNEIGQIVNKSVRRVSEKVYEEHHKRYDLSKPSLGIGRVASLGKIIRLRNDLGKYAISPTLSVLQSFTFTNIDCLYASLNSEKFQNQFRNLSNGSTRQSVGIKDLREVKIYFPLSQKEQNLIGNVFIRLDKLITLQQRKLKQLKQLKKAMLQIIANNRFLFHTKKVDMIKVRVADIYKITRGNVLARSEISNVQTSKYPYPVYSSQTKNHGLMGYYKDFLFKNAITWTTDGANAGTVKYRKGRFYSTNVNGVLLSSEGLANQLTAELLNLVAFKYVSHVGNPKLMNNTMGEIIFNIPKNVENQQYFSDCIESVINLIDKQEKATDKLNKLKKYLLQKLFI